MPNENWLNCEDAHTDAHNSECAPYLGCEFVMLNTLGKSFSRPTFRNISFIFPRQIGFDFMFYIVTICIKDQCLIFFKI